MPNKPICLIDLDGTVADYDGALRRDLAAMAGPNDPPLDTSRVNPPWLEARRKTITRQRGWFAGLNGYPPGLSLLSLAERLQYDVHILTKGPGDGNRGAWTEKAEWCDQHVPGYPVHVVSNKGMVYGRVLIDDWPPYCFSWLEWRPRGLVIMPAHPWNEGISHPNIVRYVLSNHEEVEKRMIQARDRKDGEA